MPPKTYFKGTLVRLSATFTDPLNGDAAIDPDALEVRILDPAGVTATFVFGTDPEVISDGVGLYHIDVTPTQAGIWSYTWEGQGAGQSVASASFFVRETLA